MQLIDLPAELIVYLSYHLDSVNDLYSLISTSRVFYNLCANSLAALPPRFPKRYGYGLLQPHPYLLLAGTARQIADWAVQSEGNRQNLYDAITRGSQGLLDLAEQVSRLSLNDVRALYKANNEIVNPLSLVLVPRCLPYLNGRYNETTYEAVERALYHHWIYCELFHHTVDKVLDPSLDIVPLSRELRLHWISQCMQAPRGKQDRQLYDYESVHDSDEFMNFTKISQLLLGRVPAQDGVNPYQYLGLSPQEFLFVKAMEHQGLLTMKILQADGEATRQDLSMAIRNQANAIPTANIRLDPEWNIAKEHRVGWYDMRSDVDASITVGKYA